jgi:hypothetical protein
MKTIKHHWIKQDGFRIHKCERCGCIRRWDSEWLRYDGGYGKLVYERRFYKNIEPPSCYLPNTLMT